MPSIHTSTSSGTERKYTFRPLKCKTFKFQVKANANVNLCLSPTASETPYHQYEIFLAGWGGGVSAMRRNKKDDVHKVNTPGILHKDSFKGFWVVVGDHAISVGYEGQPQPFLVHQDPLVKFDFSYYGYCTSCGTTGQWIFSDEDYGSLMDMGSLDVALGFQPPPPYYPMPPVKSGRMSWFSGSVATCPSPVTVAPGASNVYVAAAHHEGDFLIGYVMAPNFTVCHISYAGRVHSKSNFFFLSNPGNEELVWESARRGQVPTGALKAGYTASGEHLYIGKFNHGATNLVGKVHPSHGVCYTPFGGKEISSPTYNVLCLKTVPLYFLQM